MLRDPARFDLRGTLTHGRADHSRTLYHKRYSKGYHSALDYKDVALNSGSFGVKGSAEILETMIRNWLNC